MTYKQIEQAREIRLWIGQIVVPAASAVVAMSCIPEVRGAIAAKAKDIKESIEWTRMKRKYKREGL